ncbi:GNAT family N-acetyltransferase [Sporomusa acidovorans]|uniref:N-acetyltransferase domain-containing protein n=1 Tax=Sporomusa acidovorans (strain ATCC 49682 / DSM 3132 / Mol) TaxID=1123286 RepID=A0ABZ3J2L5_SPOA4|nr:GNAT family N-acetyltransferase [Sporomusa acidovorans]OZC23225.1 hypothetical protein SPACI_08750 [Sporomusa acidovorans DSM 3132]SDE98069.1 Acetyltransferase (GNAT) family protein [Sporomusa acidovorans]
MAPLAVAPDYQRKGIGGRLSEAGHRVARKLEFKSVLLVGYPGYYPHGLGIGRQKRLVSWLFKIVKPLG